MHPNRRRRRVTDAHLAEADHIAACFERFVDDRGTSFHAQVALRIRHGWSVKEVLSPPPDATIHYATLVREFVIDACIDDYQLETMLSAKKIDPAAAMNEIAQLLPRDFFGRLADPFRCDAVIACP